jgi:hypothetical protein
MHRALHGKPLLPCPHTHELQLRKVKQKTRYTNTFKAPANCARPHQGSQARRRVEIHGPKARNFGKCGRVFDRLIEILGPKRLAYRPVLPPNCTCPPAEAPWGAAGRNWPRPFHPLVEIFKGSLRALDHTLCTLCADCSSTPLFKTEAQHLLQPETIMHHASLLFTVLRKTRSPVVRCLRCRAQPCSSLQALLHLQEDKQNTPASSSII